MKAEPVRLFGAVPEHQAIRTSHDLVLFLGGDTDSFTDYLVALIAKADHVNRPKLRAVYPREVRAWEIWHQVTPSLTAAELDAAITTYPGPPART